MFIPVLRKHDRFIILSDEMFTKKSVERPDLSDGNLISFSDVRANKNVELCLIPVTSIIDIAPYCYNGEIPDYRDGAKSIIRLNNGEVIYCTQTITELSHYCK